MELKDIFVDGYDYDALIKKAIHKAIREQGLPQDSYKEELLRV